jgi:hypothetical protein
MVMDIGTTKAVKHRCGPCLITAGVLCCTALDLVLTNKGSFSEVVAAENMIPLIHRMKAVDLAGQIYLFGWLASVVQKQPSKRWYSAAPLWCRQAGVYGENSLSVRWPAALQS